MSHKGIRAAAALGCLLIMSSLVGFYARAKHNQQDAAAAVNYAIIDDDMGTKLKIGVPASIDEKQLRATLRKAADDHQYDAARDLLLSDYLWVEAYLSNGRTQSETVAGRLRRYVPPKNSNRERWSDWLSRIAGRGDKVSVSLADARQSLH
jgi:hypothetical protein